jgi:hypothetical protein
MFVTLHLGCSHLAKLVLQRRGFRVPEFLAIRIAETVLVPTIKLERSSICCRWRRSMEVRTKFLLSLAFPEHGRGLPASSVEIRTSFKSSPNC